MKFVDVKPIKSILELEEFKGKIIDSFYFTNGVDDDDDSLSIYFTDKTVLKINGVTQVVADEDGEDYVMKGEIKIEKMMWKG